MSKTEKATKKYLQTLSKDRVIELCLQFIFDVEVSELQLDQLKQQLAEKDKEIKVRNDKLGKLKKQLTDCLNSLKRKTQSNRDLQSIRYKANRQLAIQELEKVKMLTEWKFESIADVVNQIDQQINELKGE